MASKCKFPSFVFEFVIPLPILSLPLPVILLTIPTLDLKCPLD